MKHKLLILIVGLMAAMTAMAQEFGAIATSGGITATVQNNDVNPWTFPGDGTATITGSGGSKHYYITMDVDTDVDAWFALDFTITGSYGNGRLYIDVDDVQQNYYYDNAYTNSSFNTNSGTARTFIPTGHHTVKLDYYYYNGYRSDLSCSLSNLRLFPQSDVATLIDCDDSDLEWSVTTPENYLPWCVEGDAAHTANARINTKTGMKLSVNATQPLELSFDYYISSSSSDYLMVTDENGYNAFNLSGWNNDESHRYNDGTFRVYIPEGLHTYTISYARSQYDPGYGNRAEVSNIQLRSSSSQVLHINQQTAGNVGLEAVANLGNLTAVRYLKVSGPMNADDWAKIKSMTSLVYLDLTDAQVTEIPASAFTSNPLRFFYFPTTLQTIGNNAFEYRNIEGAITIPEGVTTIGNYAFRGLHKATSVTLPNSLTSLGTYAFRRSDGTQLREVTLGSGLTVIPNYAFNDLDSLRVVHNCGNITALGEDAFYNCEWLTSLEGLRPVTVGSDAFNYCKKLASIDLSRCTTLNSGAFYRCYGLTNLDLTNVTSMGSSAFAECTGLTSVVIPDGLTTVPSYAFRDCNHLATVTLGASLTILYYDAFNNCPVTAIYVNAPAPPSRDGSNNPFYYSGSRFAAATLYVPQYAMVSYKLHEYWSQYKVIEANPNRVERLSLASDLVLTSNARIPDTPDVTIAYNGHLTVNGDNAQPIGAFVINNQNDATASGVLISHCENITSTSTAVRYYLGYSSNPYWYYLCLPFDVRVEDITNTANAAIVIREYDAAGRADHGPSGNWVDVAPDATLHAGHGYIMTASAATYATFPATAETRQAIFTPAAVTTPLDAHASVQPTDAGWNLVGNVYPAYYDIYYMDYTAPITVWSTGNRSYTAYSVADDNLALLPFQAFFVQRPENVDVLTLNPAGRQTSSVIDHSAASVRRAPAAGRSVINLTLSDGQFTDRTRVVINAAASDDFDAATDATKMMSYEGAPQFYSLLADDSQLAINEGQQQSGLVDLGMYLPADGTYTIDLTRADIDVQLLDDGQIVQMPYTFSAPAGTLDRRFSIVVTPGVVTGIDSTLPSSLQTLPSYDLQGRRVKSPAVPFLRKGSIVISK